MGAELEKRYPGIELDLIGGGRGDFIVIVNGERIWDKRGVDSEFPQHAEIIRRIEALS